MAVVRGLETQVVVTQGLAVLSSSLHGDWWLRHHRAGAQVVVARGLGGLVVVTVWGLCGRIVTAVS